MGRGPLLLGVPRYPRTYPGPEDVHQCIFIINKSQVYRQKSYEYLLRQSNELKEHAMFKLSRNSNFQSMRRIEGQQDCLVDESVKS